MTYVEMVKLASNIAKQAGQRMGMPLPSNVPVPNPSSPSSYMKNPARLKRYVNQAITSVKPSFNRPIPAHMQNTNYAANKTHEMQRKGLMPSATLALESRPGTGYPFSPVPATDTDLYFNKEFANAPVAPVSPWKKNVDAIANIGVNPSTGEDLYKNVPEPYTFPRNMAPALYGMLDANQMYNTLNDFRVSKGYPRLTGQQGLEARDLLKRHVNPASYGYGGGKGWTPQPTANYYPQYDKFIPSHITDYNRSR